MSTLSRSQSLRSQNRSLSEQGTLVREPCSRCQRSSSVTSRLKVGMLHRGPDATRMEANSSPWTRRHYAGAKTAKRGALATLNTTMSFLLSRGDGYILRSLLDCGTTSGKTALLEESRSKRRHRPDQRKKGNSSNQESNEYRTDSNDRSPDQETSQEGDPRTPPIEDITNLISRRLQIVKSVIDSGLRKTGSSNTHQPLF